jgi:hypothetical protein
MSNKNDFYSSASGRTEIDLRSEFKNTMYGKGPEIAKHQKGLLRVFRLDNQNNKVPCPCIDPVTGEADRETRCPICLGEGALWDEQNIEFYHTKVGTESSNVLQDKLHAPGLINTEMEVFYLPHQFNLTKDDKIVILSLDKEGFPVIPLTRNQLFRIAELRPMRLDSGRLEFWKAYTYEDNSKFL